MLTEKRVADVLGDLVSRLARLGEVKQLATQHSLELLTQHARRVTNYSVALKRRAFPLPRAEGNRGPKVGETETPE